ncbi:MAG TPA: hypothetical protein VF815_40510 [Myxococcaceae bacterium]|jgi:antitoxin component YwqK of YwqJK toxin-antitoxin module
MSSHWLLPALFLLALLALPTPAEASCSGMQHDSEAMAECQKAETERIRRYHQAHQESNRFMLSVGKHSQLTNEYEYRTTGVCQLTGLDGVHTLKTSSQFDDNGPPFESYPPKTRFMRIGCKNGKQHGDQIKYFPNGDVAERYAFQNGELHGRFEIFHSSKKLFSSGTYKHGKQQRLSYFWSGGFEERRESSPKNPGLETISIFKNGQPHTGIWKYQGRVGHEIVYRVKNGLLHGPSEEYQNGVVTQRRNYKRGLLVTAPSSP